MNWRKSIVANWSILNQPINYQHRVYSCDLELLLYLCQLLHLLSQLERAHDGVGIGKGHVGWACQGFVGVESWPGTLEGIVVLLGDAVSTLAVDWVWFLDGVTTVEEHLDNLVVVVVGCQDEGRDVRRELTLFVSPEERILHGSFVVLSAGYVVGMLDYDLCDTA